MARSTSTNYSAPSFPKATVDEDPFDAHDVQQLAAAVDGHDHTTGKGAVLAAGSIPAGSITSGMIADGTIVAGDIANGAVTTDKILDGTIATADLANAAVTNAKLASDTARANLLTNGGMELWQRGNGPFTTHLAYTADRWQLSLSGGDTASVQRVSTGQLASVYGAAIAATHSPGAVDLFQTLKTSEEPLIGKTVTFSALVWANAAGASLILVRDGTSGGSAQSAAHPGNSTWQTLSISAVVPGDATNVQCHFWIVGSGTVNVDNAMLVVGAVAADYAPLHPADDLARCNRYYEVLAEGYLFAGWAGAASEAVGGSIRMRMIKPVTPTVTKIGTFTPTNAATPAIGAISTDGFQLYALSNGAGHVQYASGPSEFITIESNP